MRYSREQIVQCFWIRENLQDRFYTQIEEAVDFVLRNIRLGATIDGLVRKEKYELPPEAIRGNDY